MLPPMSGSGEMWSVEYRREIRRLLDLEIDAAKAKANAERAREEYWKHRTESRKSDDGGVGLADFVGWSTE